MFTLKRSDGEITYRGFGRYRPEGLGPIAIVLVEGDNEIWSLMDDAAETKDLSDIRRYYRDCGYGEVMIQVYNKDRG